MLVEDPLPVAISDRITPNRIFTLPSNINVPVGFFSELHEKEEGIEDLATGTLRLINLCIDRKIDTVFFLDRSSRPASVLFRQVWQALLSESPKPEIRFINMGKDNQELQEGRWPWTQKWGRVHKKLAARYNNLNPRGNILVADEFLCTGYTINRAKKLIQKMYPQASVLATGLFSYTPSWYNHMDVLMDLSEDNSRRFNSFFSRKVHHPAGSVLKFRQDLSKLAELIAQHTGTSPRGSLTVKPFDPGHKITTS